MKSKTFIWIIFLLTLISCKKAIIPDVPPIVVVAEAYALPSSVAYGGNTTLYWSSKNVTSVTKNGIPLLTTSGSEDLTALIKETSFTLEFKGLDGKIITKSVTIPVASKIVVVSGEASASPANILYDGSTTLSWKGSPDVTSVTVNDVPMLTTTGSQEFKSLKENTTFTVKFKGSNGKAVAETIIVTVAPKPIEVIPTKLDTLMSLLCNKPWKDYSIEDHSLDGKLLTEFELSEDEKNIIWTYNYNKSWTIDESANGKGVKTTNPGSFGFSEDCKYIWFNDRSNKFEFILTKDTYIRIIPNYINEINGEKTPIKTYVVQKL
jgi:hypothetical protein